MRHGIFTLLVSAFAAGVFAAPDCSDLLPRTEAREYRVQGGGVYRYRWVEPKNPEPGRVYPLVVLMHGAGERGTDNARQLLWGAREILDYLDRTEKGGYYFVAGQVPEGRRWVEVDWSATSHTMPGQPSETMSAQIEFLGRLFDDGKRQIDRRRVYVTGISMGGYGTWDLASRHPEWFAAAMPVCGGGDTAQAWRLRNLPIWIHHGDRDGVVPTVRSRNMTAALWAVSGNVKYTEYPGVGHGVWTPAYGNEANLRWLFSQRRPKKVLLVSKCFGYRHLAGIAAGDAAIKAEAERTRSFTVETCDSFARLAEPGYLAGFDALVLNNTTTVKAADFPGLEAALTGFVKAGGGLCLIHAAVDAFYDSPAIQELNGGLFHGHPWPHTGTWRFVNEQPDHPLNASFGKAPEFSFADEIYMQRSAPYDRSKLTVLVSLSKTDAANVAAEERWGKNPKVNTRFPIREDRDFAVSWVKTYGSGRVFYTSFGHNERAFADARISAHIFAGLGYCLGD